MDEVKSEIGRRFELALQKAAEVAGAPNHQNKIIKLFGAGRPGVDLKFDETLEIISLERGLTYRVIDVGFMSLDSGAGKYFVRLSDHPPVSAIEVFSAGDLSPFKVLEPLN